MCEILEFLPTAKQIHLAVNGVYRDIETEGAGERERESKVTIYE